jgi:pilus assembly protein FimV
VVNSPKNCRKKSLVLATALVLLPLWGNAAGLGRITVQSGLGQPLRAELEVTAARDEIPSLVAKVATADAFRIAGIEYQSALSSVQFSKEVKERNGRRYIEVVSDKPINEPFVDILIELSWSSGRLVREYTFLLDPPEMQKPPAAPVVIPEVRTAERAPVMIPAMVAGRSVADAPALTSSYPASPPARVNQAQAAPRNAASANASTRTVVPGDTLGRIAAQSKPEGVSLDQMLVALFRGNRDAFSGENMNRLKAGKILNIPSAAEASGVEKTEARREVVAQAADFNAYRSKRAALALSAPATQSSSSQSSSGKIAPKVSDSAAKSNTGDKLEVSKTAGTKTANASGQPLQGRLSSLEEDLVARDRALREANSRIGDLEKNLNDLKKLAELKSQSGAGIQKQAENSKPDAAAPAVDAASPKPSAPIGGVSPAPTGTVSGEVEKSSPKPADAAVASGSEKPAAKPKVVVPPPPEPEPDLLSDTDFLMKLGAGLALLLAMGGIFVARRKRKTAVREEPITQSSLSANSVFSESSSITDSNVSKATPTDYSVSEPATASVDEPLDPIVEADTFLAFGRDAQAEERLLEGLAADPGRHAIHVKLLEIYAGRRSTLQFNTLAQDLRDQTGGSGPDWERALAMGQNLDPNNALYQTVSDAPAPEANPEATMIFSAPVNAPAAEMAAVDAPAASGLDFDLGLDDEEAAPAAETAKAETVNIDFDLDLGGDAPAQPEPASGGLDIDFELDAPSVSNTEPSVAAPMVADPSDISFDLEMPKAAAPAAADMNLDLSLPEAEAATTASLDAAGVDFEFDLGTVKLDAPVLSAMNPSAPLDLDGISLELDAPPTEPLTMSTADTAGDNPEAATKLELAVAYEEMGDRDGARELLAEVLKEGSASQQAAAKARLDQLS